MLLEVYQWMKLRQKQLIPYPLDPESLANLSRLTLIGEGAGSTSLTQSYPVVGGTGAITGPKAFAGSIIIDSSGSHYEVPAIAIT